MKKFLCLLFACALLFGCVKAEPQQTPSPTLAPNTTLAPAPAPTPSPAPSATVTPTKVLFAADCSAAEAADFFFGAAHSPAASGWLISTHSGQEGFDEAVLSDQYNGIIVLCTKQDTSLDSLSAAIQAGAKVAIADMYKRNPPEGASYSWFDSAAAASETLETAITYPPHDTPVRLIALLEKEGSPADEVFRAGAKRGRIFAKAVHYETAKQSARDFFAAQLDRYVEGTIDAVYAETQELARMALDALLARGRTDMEVFCVPAGALSAQSSLYQKWTYPVLMGADLFVQGESRASAITSMMAGDEPRNEAFAPVSRKQGEPR